MSGQSSEHRSAATSTSVSGATPLLRVLRGAPDAAELAAVTAVLAAFPRRPAAAAPVPRSSWASPARAVDRTPAPGPGGWRASALPR